jgi:hypothetical protein
MQKHLEKTAAALKDRPAEALAPFQKMLGRTSYFSTSAHAGQWVVMFGPKPGSTTAVASLPKQPAVLQPVLAPDFPAFSRRVTVFGAACLHFVVDSARSLYQWLMHPVVDTREPS